MLSVEFLIYVNSLWIHLYVAGDLQALESYDNIYLYFLFLVNLKTNAKIKNLFLLQRTLLLHKND